MRRSLRIAGRLSIACVVVVACAWPRPARTEATGLSAASAPRTGMEDYFLDEVRLSSDGRRFVLSIRTPAPWSHWTLGDPARIIVDLGSTRSRLPNAPGLYRVELGKGVLRSFRTSQHLNTPLDRRVRITLELTRIVPFEARRVGEEIQIVIPDDGSGRAWSQVIGSSGRDDFAPEEEEVVHDEEVAPAPPPAETPERPEDLSGGLRDAFEGVVGTNQIDEIHETAHGDPAEPATAADLVRATAVEHDVVPARWGEEQSVEEAEHLENVEAEQEAEAARPEVASQLHDDRAATLLAEGLARWLEHEDPRGALDATARLFRFYEHTRVAPQAGLLRRELLTLLGEDFAADTWTLADSVPDIAILDARVFAALLQGNAGRGAWLEVDRLLRTWGDFYPAEAIPAEIPSRLGEALVALGKLDEARERLLRVAPGDPGEARALLVLARLEEESGHPELALEYYRRLSVLETSPLQQRGLARTADLEFQGGDIAAALASYERLLEGTPPADEEIWAVFQTANCLALLGDHAGARVRYEAVLTRWPQSYWAGFAQERLEALEWNRSLTHRMAGSPR